MNVLTDEKKLQTIERILKIMRQLRDPDSGCPWDSKQSLATIVPYTIEEAYEVADAIERNDWVDLKGELGDLFFQVIFYCQLTSEIHHFDFYDVVNGISDKLISRHPHVFGDKQFDNEDDIHKAWEDQKHKERKNKNGSTSLMDDIPLSLPALKRAQKMQKRAAKQGFDWPDVEGVWDKIHEEIDEVKQEELAFIRAKKMSNDDIKESEIKESRVNECQAALEDEIGDLLFATVNLARHHKLDAEVALQKASKKFEKRFRKMEESIAKDEKQLSELSLNEMENYWQSVKRATSEQ